MKAIPKRLSVLALVLAALLALPCLTAHAEEADEQAAVAATVGAEAETTAEVPTDTTEAEAPDEAADKEILDEPSDKEGQESPSEGLPGEAKTGGAAAELNGTPQTVTAAIAAGNSYTVTISSPGQKAYYEFRPSVSGTYTLFSSTTKDTKVELYDSNWDYITYDDDGGEGNNFRLTGRFDANTTYYYSVGFWGSGTGSFPMTLQMLNPGWNQQGNEWLYVDANGNFLTGLQTIGGQLYFFNLKGILLTSQAVAAGSFVYYADADGVLTMLSLGWNQRDGKWYYVSYDNEAANYYFYQNGVYRIGSAWYGFDFDGVMYADGPFYENDFYYHAKADGKLYVNEWVKDIFGRWHYYGEEGRAPYGVSTVGGKRYYFYDHGLMAVNEIVIDDGYDAVVAGSNGVLTSLKTGWNRVDDCWYYLAQDGYCYRDNIHKINGALYAFDARGVMYADCSFSGNCYRAKADGKLYVNEWYKGSNGRWYYYGEDGCAATYIRTVNGKDYFFHPELFYMYVNELVDKDSTPYMADGSGVLTPLKKGWNHVGYNWFYFDGSNLYRDGIYEISGLLYGFDEVGAMYADRLFFFDGYDFRAKANGSLYVNEWYQDFYGNRFYYGANGRAARNLTLVGGKLYLFGNSDGELIFDEYRVLDGLLYRVDLKGVATPITATGAYRDKRGELYYVSGGRVLVDAWKKVDGKWYYFMYGSAVRNDILSIDGKPYAFGPDGVMAAGGWFYSVGRCVYAGADGVLLTGQQKIDGKWYYFDELGYMRTGLQKVGGSYYLYDSDGVYIGKAKGEGWNQIRGTWYYVEDGVLFYHGLKSIDGVLYLFFDGKMQTDTTGYGYIFGADGKQVKNGWYRGAEGFYYVDGATGEYVSGPRIIDGKEYYFNDWGSMFIGEQMSYDPYANATVRRVYGADGALTEHRVLTTGWYLINGDYFYYEKGAPYCGWKDGYYLDEGRMLTNALIDGYWLGEDGKYVKSGWIQDLYGDYRFAKSGGKLARNEWITRGGQQYYFDDYCRAVTGVQIIGGKVYQFDDSCRLVATLASSVTDGWLKAGDTYAYIAHGSVLRDGIYTIGKSTYHFGRDGLMMKNGIYVTYRRLQSGIYVGADGKQVDATGWVKVNGAWYYIGLNHIRYTGVQTVKGKTYGFDFEGRMLTGWQMIGGRLYHFGDDGALVAQDTTENGWVKKDDDWYYAKNGLFLYDEIAVIKGKVFGFDYSGAMVRNRVMYGYFFGADGAAVTQGWHTDADGVKWYADATGKVLSGIRKIDGKIYYFPRYHNYG